MLWAGGGGRMFFFIKEIGDDLFPPDFISHISASR
jgi:hypothetical protein